MIYVPLLQHTPVEPAETRYGFHVGQHVIYSDGGISWYPEEGIIKEFSDFKEFTADVIFSKGRFSEYVGRCSISYLRPVETNKKEEHGNTQASE